MEDIDTMILKFDVIKHTHPQLYLFWVNYLTIKITTNIRSSV